MAITPKCSACDDLRENAPDFVVNGLTTEAYTSLKNDTGLNPSSGHTDCRDLNDMNDCLISNMDKEVDSYQVCDWKSFIKNLIPNLWTMFKSIIGAICGLWTHIHKHECYLDALFSGVRFSMGEEPTDGGSYVVAGKGISFLIPHGSQTGIADAHLTYVAGGLVYGAASLQWFQEDFTDEASCVNFDNGSTQRTSKSRKGNSEWANTGSHGGGELLIEFRVNTKEYPQIKRFFNGFGQETGGGSYQVRAMAFSAGQYAYGQHGGCNVDTGAGHTGCDDGHLVPNNYIYVQVRLTSLFEAVHNNIQLSPAWLMGIRLEQDEIKC